MGGGGGGGGGGRAHMRERVRNSYIQLVCMCSFTFP